MGEACSERLTKKQQEPKLTAYISQDAQMIQSFKEGKDIYSFIASIAFNKTYEDCLENRPTGEVDENGDPIVIFQPDGKARRSESKSVLLGRPRVMPRQQKSHLLDCCCKIL
jgi:hypothetical protein